MTTAVHKRVARIFQATLDTMLPAVVSSTQQGSGAIEIEVRTKAWSRQFLVLWAGEGWPADVDAVMRHVAQPWPRDVVVAARRLSSGALRHLVDRDANWIDETGRIRILDEGLTFSSRSALLVADISPHLAGG